MIERAYVEIGNVCNMNCSFCVGTRRPPRQMSAEEFEIVARRLRGKTKYVYLHVLGEPLMHSELSEILDIIRDSGLRAAITTNGTLLSERSSELIEKSDVLHKVSVSLHSFEGNGMTGGMPEYIKSISDYAKRASDDLGYGKSKPNEIHVSRKRKQERSGNKYDELSCNAYY